MLTWANRVNSESSWWYHQFCFTSWSYIFFLENTRSIWAIETETVNTMFPIMQLERVFYWPALLWIGLLGASDWLTINLDSVSSSLMIGCLVSKSSVLTGHLCALIGQLCIEAGPEETWVTVGLHQAENLILGQLEIGRVNAKKQALIGRFSDSWVHVDLETESSDVTWPVTGQIRGQTDRQTGTCLAALVEINSS